MIKEKTEKNAALIYRLNGDWNPLYVNTDRAAVGGYTKPILHNMCIYGIVGRIIFDYFCDGDPLRIKQLKARFISHVYPGESLLI